MFNFIKKLFGTVDDGSGITENKKYKNMESRRGFMKNATAGIISAPFIVDTLMAESKKTGKPIDIKKAKSMMKTAKIDHSIPTDFSTQCYSGYNRRILYGNGHDAPWMHCDDDIHDMEIYYENGTKDVFNFDKKK